MLSRTEPPPPQLGGRDPVGSDTPNLSARHPHARCKSDSFSLGKLYRSTQREPRDGVTGSVKEKCSDFSRCQVGESHKQKAKQRKTKQNKRNHLAEKERFNLWKGDFSTPVLGLSVDFTPTQLLSIRTTFKRRGILESFNEIHWKKKIPFFPPPSSSKVRMRISTQMRHSALLYLSPPFFFFSLFFF